MLRKIIFVLMVLMTATVTSTTSSPQPKISVVQSVKDDKPTKLSEEYVKGLISVFASQYNVNGADMWRVISCENRDLIPTLQSYSRYPVDIEEWGVKAGDRELSYGLVQIHLPSHPDVSYKQAIDHMFSIEFMAKEFSKGKQSKWSCY
jgi:hypothetical protein